MVTLFTVNEVSTDTKRKIGYHGNIVFLFVAKTLNILKSGSTMCMSDAFVGKIVLNYHIYTKHTAFSHTGKIFQFNK